MSEIRGISKLKQVLINDKHFNPERLNEVITGDLYKILQNYMEINRDDMLARIDIDDEGNYVLRCKVKCKRLKIMGLLS